jgi:type IV pilus assembly protein PilA
MKSQTGFTLIELMIVISIILIISAIAIPALVNSKISANEASAVASLRAINAAEVSYQTTYPGKGFANSLTELGGADPCAQSEETSCLLDQSLASGTKAGYRFAAVGGNPVNGENTTYVAGAGPVSFNRSGVRLFCSTEKNVMRANGNRDAGITPPTAEQCAAFAAMQ